MSNKTTAILLPATVLMGLVIGILGIASPSLEGAISSVGRLGGPLNFAVDWMGALSEMALYIGATVAIIWGVSAIIMFARDGEWSIYFEHIVWQLMIGLGLIAFVLPGIIIWALLAYKRGVSSALLVLLGPIGSSIIASTESIWKAENYAFVPRGARRASRHGIGPDLSNISSTLTSPVSIVVGLVVLIVVSVLGLTSGLIWSYTPIWAHFIMFAALGIGISYAFVNLIDNMSVTNAAITGLSVVLFLSLFDVMVSGLQFTGAMVSVQAVEAGLLGGASVDPIAIFGMFWGPAMGAFIGNIMSNQGWSKRRVIIAVIASFFAAIGVLIILG